MSVRNSSRVSARYARRNNGLIIVRNFFLFTLLLGGCFVLGFKVLAPLLPSGQKPVPANTALPAASDSDSAASGDDTSHAASARPTPTRRTPPDDGLNAAAPEKTPSRFARKPAADDGTVLESEGGANGVQTPSSTDGSRDGTKAGAPGDPSNPALDAVPGSATDRTGTGETDAALRPSKKRNRRHSSSSSNGLDETTDATGAATNTDPDLGSTDDINEERSAPSHSAASDSSDPVAPPVRSRNGYYRVQMGVFATREKADAEARRAQEQKLDATVIPVRRHGRILYRVQHAVYQQWGNAQAAEKRLRDKGFDASIN